MELETDEENEKNDIDDEEDDLGKSSKNLIEVVAFNNGNGQARRILFNGLNTLECLVHLIK